MSVQASIHSRKGIKIKKNLGSKQEASPINPEILTYIQKVQNDNDKSKVLNQTKNNMPIQVERIITNKLINTNISTGLNEDMTYDKDKRFTAKKGLLYLLNNLSNGTFCPDIEEYFSKMKEAKMEEFKHKSRLLDSNIQKSGEESDGKKRSNKKRNTREPTYKRLLNNMENNIEESQVNESKKNLFRKNDNSEIRDEIGIKKYEKDYDADDLKYLYDKKEIKDNTFQINFNKEKMIKMKLKNENKNTEK
jgi:hypothetical protein